MSVIKLLLSIFVAPLICSILFIVAVIATMIAAIIVIVIAFVYFIWVWLHTVDETFSEVVYGR